MPSRIALLLSVGALGLGMGVLLQCPGQDVPLANPPNPPQEPVTLPLLTDYGFDDPLPVGTGRPVGTSGWWINNLGLGATLVADSTAPFSPPAVGQWVYPAGFAAGVAPATMYFTTVLNISEVYVSFWWKPSNPWQFNASNNKIAFVFAGGGGAGGQMFISMTDDGRLRCATEFPADARNLEPNVAATPITLGQWHHVELYLSKSRRTVQWSLDGVLQGRHGGIRFPPQPFSEYQFSPTWGGVDDTKTQTDYYWFDHVRIRGR